MSLSVAFSPRLALQRFLDDAREMLDGQFGVLRNMAGISELHERLQSERMYRSPLTKPHDNEILRTREVAIATVKWYALRLRTVVIPYFLTSHASL